MMGMFRETICFRCKKKKKRNIWSASLRCCSIGCLGCSYMSVHWRLWCILIFIQCLIWEMFNWLSVCSYASLLGKGLCWWNKLFTLGCISDCPYLTQKRGKKRLICLVCNGIENETTILTLLHYSTTLL